MTCHSYRVFSLIGGIALAMMGVEAKAVTQPLAYLSADRQAAKVELRVDGILVVRITCDGARRFLFDFSKDEGFASLRVTERRMPLTFGFEEGGTYRLATRDSPKRLLGRLRLTPRFMRDLDHARLGWFWAPNDMGEAWPVVNLGALRRLARECPTSVKQPTIR